MESSDRTAIRTPRRWLGRAAKKECPTDLGRIGAPTRQSLRIGTHHQSRCRRLRQRHTVGVVIAILTIALPACRRAEFKGDGRLVDRGFWAAHPRYVIELHPEIHVTDGERDAVYRFTGAIGDESSLSFRAATPLTPDNVRQSAVSLRVMLREEGGAMVCKFESRIAEMKIWTKGAAPIELWSPDCNMVKLDPARPYELHVSVTGGTVTDTWRLLPTIIGGGWDTL